MLSVVHATVVELLEAHPDALSYLLSLEGPAPTAPLVPTTGTRSKTFTLERRVDRAYVLGSREKPQGFMLGEVQMDVDPDKVYAWALYVELAQRRDCVPQRRPRAHATGARAPWWCSRSGQPCADGSSATSRHPRDRMALSGSFARG